MYKYTQTEFVAMMDELMDKFKKGCQKSDAELEAAYKILNPAPVGGFIDSLVKMDKYYGTDLWEIKRKQIKCFISKCDRYETDDIVAYCRAKFFKDEINRIIYDKSIAEECDVCIFADSTILSPEWPYLCAKVYVSITWIDEGKSIKNNDRSNYKQSSKHHLFFWFCLLSLFVCIFLLSFLSVLLWILNI